ncbi:MAG: hypothetical protein QOF04_1346 [Solirubrobacteraceae bacterium]|nr:hypothetical protein [Solirubrobacteraceae bacterium]
MTSRLSRLLPAAGVLLVLALPATAPAHGGGRDHARGACKAVQDGAVPRGLTAEQAQTVATACTTRDAAVKAADDTFLAATTAARDTYRAAVTPIVAQIRTAADAKRAACRPDRRAQACRDARAAHRTTVQPLAQQIRAAREAYRAAVRPAAETRRTAVRAAKQAFEASVRPILRRS